MEDQRPVQGLMGSAVRAKAAAATKPAPRWDGRRWRQLAMIVFLAWIPFAILLVSVGHGPVMGKVYPETQVVPASPIYTIGLWMLTIAVIGFFAMLVLGAVVKGATMVKNVK